MKTHIRQYKGKLYCGREEKPSMTVVWPRDIHSVKAEDRCQMCDYRAGTMSVPNLILKRGLMAIELTDAQREYFARNEKMPFFSVSADVGCHKHILIDVLDENNKPTAKHITNYVKNAFEAAEEDLVEYADEGKFTIELVRVTKRQLMDSGEYVGC